MFKANLNKLNKKNINNSYKKEDTKLMKKIILTGGGTAGHIYPALAVAEKLNQYEIHYFGGNGMEKDILKNFPSIIFHEIPTVKLERKLTFKNLLIPFKLLKSIKICKKEIEKLEPNIIFSKGGFVAVPVVIAGAKQKVPIISHESDLSFGLANKIILRYCTCMCTTFEKTASQNKKCVYTGQPIREKILSGKEQKFFKNENPTLLVLGGSLGAKFLNDLVLDNLEDLTKSFNIIHITGQNNYKKINHKNYISLPYTNEIENYYASADIVLSRAGSGVINELLSLNKLMLLIPLSKKCSRGDQIENAKYFQKLGYAEMLEEENVSYLLVKQKLMEILKNKQKYLKNMKKSGKISANSLIFELIEKYERKNNS